MDLISKKDCVQEQKAGDNSNQIMVKGDLNLGITESQARDICKAECAIALQNWTFQAGAFAEQRIQSLENKLLPKMLSYDKNLSVFGDPGFQILLRKAQIAAASSERENDYEILSDLLLHRAEQNKDRERRLGIAKAIEIVDQIDDTALVALSIVYAVTKYVPISHQLHEGLKALDSLYGKIINNNNLPYNSSWQEHLDLLSAIRISPKDLHSFKKLEEYIPGQLEHYFINGIQIDSDEYKDIEEKFLSVGLPFNCIKPHLLKDGYVYLTTPKDIKDIYLKRPIPNGYIQVPLTEQQKKVFEYANEICFKINAKDESMRKKFWEIWEQYPYLKQVKMWWNNLSGHFTITSVGVALANAYIRGKEPSVPSLY